MCLCVELQSGREASMVAEIVEVEENSSSNMRTLRVPPVITVNKSAAYVLYELTYIRVCTLVFILPQPHKRKILDGLISFLFI